MADTILPPPEEPKQTFEPAPVPTPAPTPAPTATPSAGGLAAPGAQPTTSTAPGDNGLAGVPSPNPTTAGNNQATQGKEALNTLSQPAPLPIEAQKAQGEAMAKAAADAASKAAAGAHKSAWAPKAPKTPAAKPAADAKTGLGATLDTLAPVNDTIKKMVEGNDPIAKIQFNQILTGSGPRNQAMLQGLGMKLKQMNLDGQGAGNALLAMMARDNEFGTEQLMAQASADSAKRIWDMNVHGFDKAIEIQQEMERQKRTDFQNALTNGQLGAAKDLFGQLYPGIPFDESAARANSPAANANYNSRMKLVDQFVSQGDAASAKAIMDKLAEDMPEMFGFPNDPAAAKASIAGVDFTTEAWQNNQKNIADASAAARTAALQGDQATLSSSIDQLFSKMTPSAVEAIATSAAKSRNLDEINKILAASGMAPVASTDEAGLLDKTKFAKAVKTYDLMQDSKKNVVDGLLDTFAASDPAIATDPAARRAAKAWLSMHAYGIATNPDTGAVTNFTLDDKSTPPWDPSSPQAYLFMDWPVATFNADGTVASRDYEGLTPYSTDYKPGDLTTEKGKEDARLDKAYEQYVFSTPADERLSMDKWYYATAGGNKPVNKGLLTGSLSTPKPEPKDPMELAKAVKEKIALGQPLEKDDIDIAKTQNLISSFATSGKGHEPIMGPRAAAYLQQHPDGYVFLDGKLVHLDRGFEVGNKNFIEVTQDGKKYYIGDDGKWSETPPIKLGVLGVVFNQAGK